MTPFEIWPIIAGSAMVVFGAGSVVEKIRNGKYVNKEFCIEHNKNTDERWELILKSISEIKNHLNIDRGY